MEIQLKEHAQIMDNYLKNVLPRKINAEWLESVFDKTQWEYDEETYTKAIAEPIWELLSRGGKRWRPFLMLLAYKSVGGRGDYIKNFLALPELIHNGTLIIDDIEDESNIRRGKECIHKLYGNDIAINAGNSLYYLPLLLIIKDKSLKPRLKAGIYDIIMEEMIKLSFGQGTDIYWHKGKKLVINERRYLQMCAYKTGTLARMAAKLGALLGNASPEQIDALGKYAESIGVAFQIQDDILNITNKGWGKEFGEDITEGKRTIMIIRVLEVASTRDRQRLLTILNLRTNNRRLINEAIMIIQNYKAIEYAKIRAMEIVTNAWDGLDPLIQDSEFKGKLKLFSDFVVNRNI